MWPSKAREVFSSNFGYSNDNVTICSYVPKKNKSVVMLSTQHYTENVSGDKKKPEIILYYNSTKSGVDNMDKMVSHYSTKRRTQRWPVAFFYNIVDVACLAAFKIYTENNSTGSRTTDKRREFLQELGLQLARPHITSRAKIPNIYRNFSSRSGIECIVGKPVNQIIEKTTEPKEARDSTGRIKNKGRCWICLSTEPKVLRNTRKLCNFCSKPICAEHSQIINKCESGNQ